MPNADVKTGAPLCRAQNPELEIVKKFLFAMPHIAMDKKEYDAITESKFSGWTGTHYQMAKQMALYFTKDGLCIPRFQENVTTSDIVAYMCEWAKKYYAPNPFTKDLNKYDDLKPVVLYAYFSDCIHKGITSYKDACESLFEGIQLNNMDKVKLMLNSFTDIYIDSNGLMTFQQYATPQELILTPGIEDYLDEESFFNYFSTPNSIQVAKTTGKDLAKTPTIQKIYYGCPGTGKSFKVMTETEGDDGKNVVYFDTDGTFIPDIDSVQDKSILPTNIFRTTFHPDYDYSTFVGSYKPVMNPVLDEDGHDTGKEDLAYEFVPQVFTNAYVRAWKSLNDDTIPDEKKHVYLIIEEINRGNCAQIFGDLFQLLDRRKDGRSEYFIVPDAELRKYLAKQNLESNKLILPENLHILATMNTSDQSLFPMDSAFKRRWAMEYIPVNLEHEIAKGFTFKVNDKEYSWVKFLAKVNPLIRKATDSEDKQMGEFFIKGKISEDDFKNKVMFYIWNDVCKDLYSASRISPLYFMRSEAGEDPKHVFTFAELFGAGRYEKDEDKYTTPTELLEGFITKQLELKAIENVQE